MLTLSKKTEDIEVPMDVFMEYTRIPIVVYYGDNLPETDERPEIYEWTRRLHLMRQWAKMLNDLGGDVTIVHLPEAGLHGNTHFLMSDLNNAEVAGKGFGLIFCKMGTNIGDMCISSCLVPPYFCNIRIIPKLENI